MSLLPVAVLDRPDHAEPLARALLAGGIDQVEITLRTPAGLPGIRAASGVEGMRVGAGSVLDADQVDLVVAAGAQFVVSPGLSAEVVARARAFGVDVLPGVATGTEVMAAVALGLPEVKLFPADLLGGPAYIRALSGPFPGLRFVPSGGVTEETAREYLALPGVRTVSGSWVAPTALIAVEDWAEITRRAARFTGLVPVVSPSPA